jgi:DNA-binding transcriptional MerR regulator
LLEGAFISNFEDNRDADLAIISVGRAATLSGLSTSSLRHYETLGLVLPYRDPASGRRFYSVSDIQWLNELRRFMDRTHTGPSAVALLLSLYPGPEMRRHMLEHDCGCDCEHLPVVCWVYLREKKNAARELCRACPAYRAKELALRLHETCKVVPIAAALAAAARKL